VLAGGDAGVHRSGQIVQAHCSRKLWVHERRFSFLGRGFEEFVARDAPYAFALELLHSFLQKLLVDSQPRGQLPVTKAPYTQVLVLVVIINHCLAGV
jgi:hypothetical protein